MQVWSLALLSGLRIQHCTELWYRLQRWLGSCIAVAVAAIALIPPQAWKFPCALSAALKRQKQKNKTNKQTKNSFAVPWWLSGLRVWCHCCGMGSFPGLGTSVCYRCGQKKKKQQQKKPKQNNSIAKKCSSFSESFACGHLFAYGGSRLHVDGCSLIRMVVAEGGGGCGNVLK